MRLQRELGLVAVAAALGLGACGKKQAPVAPVPQSEPPRQTGMSETPPSRPADDGAAAEAARRRAAIEEMVFFDYDRSDIRSDAAATLSRKLPVLRDDATLRLRIDGHADERGSVEYNLALGMRRAQSVKDYLTGFGLDASRFTVQTLGEDRPLDTGRTEAAYARNRRAEFILTAGSLSSR